MGIVTKNGDFGQTKNVLGEALEKDHPMVHLQGQIDELNAHIGYLRAMLATRQMQQENAELLVLSEELKGVQNMLFRIGANVSSQFQYEYVTQADIHALEIRIEAMTKPMGDLHHFIYEYGTEIGSYYHVVRSVARRVERYFVTALQVKGVKDLPLSYPYINRLSDYFFTCARYVNHVDGIGDEKLTLSL